jgi:tetratricopeptide (TPR) repeat protein
LKTLGIDEAATLPYLLELLGVKESGLDPYSLSPEAKRDRFVEALISITIKVSHIRPLIMAIEDLHWIDKSSEESLKALLESILGEKVFLILTYRHGYVPNWTAKSYHSQVTLSRLSNRESLAMVNLLLGTENVDRDLEELILQKTEGVPFYIEEFIKSFRDLKIITREDNSYRVAKNLKAVVIPSTIHDVIMARIDSLPEGAKEVLQTGSVIEIEFSYDLINMVTNVSEQQLLAHLSLLKDLELIYERGIYPQSTYIIKHALIRDVVVESILREKKKALHEKIGRASENLFKDNIIEHCGAMVGHFIKSENYKKAAEYSRVALEKAKRSASLLDAIAYAKKSVTSLERLPQTQDLQKKIIDARTDLGLLTGQMLYFAEAKEAVDPIIDSALKLNYQRRLSQIYTILGTYYIFVEEDFPRAFKQLDEALRISEEAKDYASLYLATYWLGIAQSYNCEFEKAFLNIDKTLDFAVHANRNWLISSRKSSIGYYVYYFQGKIDLSYQYTGEGIRMAEEIGDIHSKAVAYSSHGAACYGKGLLEEAIKHLLMAVVFCEKINLYAWNTDVLFTLGDIYFEISEYQKSKNYYRKAVWILEHHRLFPSLMILNKIGLARAKVMEKEKDVDLTSLYSYVEKNRLKSNEGVLRRYIGEILLNIDEKHVSDAEHWIKKAIKADTKNGMRLRLGQDYALYAELLKRKENRAEAKKNLRRAIEILKACGAEGFLEKALKELASLK